MSVNVLNVLCLFWAKVAPSDNAVGLFAPSPHLFFRVCVCVCVWSCDFYIFWLLDPYQVNFLFYSGTFGHSIRRLMILFNLVFSG